MAVDHLLDLGTGEEVFPCDSSSGTELIAFSFIDWVSCSSG